MTTSKLFLFAATGSVLVLAYLITFYAPVDIGAFGILAVFLLMYVFFTSLSTLILQQARMAISKSRNLRGDSVSYRISYYYASVIALAPLLMLSLMSVGRMSLTSFLMVLSLVGIVSLYISRQIRP